LNSLKYSTLVLVSFPNAGVESKSSCQLSGVSCSRKVVRLVDARDH
jgi:hypothetical protein